LSDQPILPEWAPRVPQSLIRQIYENDAQGMLDESLIDEVGWALRARCESFVTAVEASRGRANCPKCSTIIQHQSMADEILTCPSCGWQAGWKDYQKTFQHKQLSGAEPLLGLFSTYIERYPYAKEYSEKMLLIDRLIHTFHYSTKFGNTRAAGVNLIGGKLDEVIAFLDGLTYGPESTPGLQESHEEWQAKVEEIRNLWRKLAEGRKQD
jgi:hypothetical protein